jgi:hypothetical protein
MLKRLGARSGTVEMRFPYFVRKAAPVSGVQSQLDYQVCWRGSQSEEGRYSFFMQVSVPATSLWPRVRTYVIEAEDFESIHNHSAFARLVGLACRVVLRRPKQCKYTLVGLRKPRRRLCSAFTSARGSIAVTQSQATSQGDRPMIGPDGGSSIGSEDAPRASITMTAS